MEREACALVGWLVEMPVQQGVTRDAMLRVDAALWKSLSSLFSFDFSVRPSVRVRVRSQVANSEGLLHCVVFKLLAARCSLLAALRCQYSVYIIYIIQSVSVRLRARGESQSVSHSVCLALVGREVVSSRLVSSRLVSSLLCLQRTRISSTLAHQFWFSYPPPGAGTSRSQTEDDKKEKKEIADAVAKAEQQQKQILLRADRQDRESLCDYKLERHSPLIAGSNTDASTDPSERNSSVSRHSRLSGDSVVEGQPPSECPTNSIRSM
ncbi:hypothetical protein V9T40_000218 [Parthenolecanium corni]|uniref:Uncharacterized protein n=1 Tax=Parthenolecanium corni TaxID=536013 RepID=A0AAN9TAS3_9HEMI